MTAQRCLVVGGYGSVGQHVVTRLARQERYQTVYIAGRRPERAEELANRLGGRVHPLYLDVRDTRSVAAALEPAPDIINCIDLPELSLVEQAACQGLIYVDVTAQGGLWRQAKQQLGASAVASGARLLFGAGLIPGVSSMMARALFDELGPGARYESAVSLSLLDQHGPAAVLYTLDEVIRNPDAFTRRRRVHFPPPVGRRWAYAFPFPEAEFYPRTLNAQAAATWLHMEPSWLNAPLAGLKHFRALYRDKGRGLVASLVQRAAAFVKPGRFALSVEAHNSGVTRRYGLVGRGQAEATALAAVAKLELLLTLPTPGVFLPEEVLEPHAFFDLMAAHGLSVRRDAGTT